MMTVHHTYTPNNDPLSVPARVRQIQSYHIDVRGWCDIGYHFLVGQDGRVYQGRYENHVGAHAGSANRDNVGISFIGNFTSTLPSDAMMTASARLLRAMSDEYRITLDRTHVKGHREVGSTSTACPGETLYRYLEQLLARARSGTPGGSSGAYYWDLPRDHFAHDSVEKLRQLGHLGGCGDHLYCPDRPMTRAELAVLLARLESSPVQVAARPVFSDVPLDHWAFSEIQEIAARGITAGCGAGQFCPNAPVLRAEAATFMKRTFGLSELRPSTPTFADVQPRHWAYGAIERAYAENILRGCAASPARFCPETQLTRAQAAVMVVRAYGL